MGTEQEIAEEVIEDEVVVEELETDDVEIELDEDGEPIAKADEDEEKVIADWQRTGDEDDELPDVPVGKHIKMKEKLKGRIKDRDQELDTIRQELEALKTSGAATAATALPPRPRSEDFDSDEKHEVALGIWEDQRIEAKLAVKTADTQKVADIERNNAVVGKAVDEHYDRTAELVKGSGMKPEYFKEADTTVRETVESVFPKQGDATTDQIISLLGEGSEKVMFFIGRNKTARLEFQSLLAEDKTGNKAMVYLGRQQQRLNNPKKQTSKAAKPATDVNGDVVVSQKSGALKKKYDDAHGKGKTQIAYNIKKEAKLAKIDTASW